MSRRVLCFGLIALFLTAPLSASLCGACATDDCDRNTMAAAASMGERADHGSSEQSPSHHSPVHNSPAQDSPPATDSHCHQAEADPATEHAGVPEPAAEDDAACHPEASLSATMDCCLNADAPTPTPEPSAVPVMVASVDIVLQSDTVFSAPLVRSPRIDDPRRRPPQLAPQPLYTLHSAFLI